MIALEIAPPLEDEGPLSDDNYLPAHDSSGTCLPLREVERLGQYVRQLVSRSDLDLRHLPILNDLVGEVLPNVDVLSGAPDGGR